MALLGTILPVTHDFAVLTPEKVVITYRLAGIGSRIMANLLDLMIATVALVMLLMALQQTLGAVSSAIAQFLTMLLVAFWYTLYFSLLEGLWNGQTLGKKAFSLRVRMTDGTPITFGAALFRNLLRFADFLPVAYLVGLATIFTSERSQRVGDIAAGTLVTHEPKAIPKFTPAPYKFGLHPFEEWVGELRKMSTEEYFAIKRLCDRFPELAPTIQTKTLREVWEPFAARHGIQPLPDVHPVYLMEAAVMRYGREHGLL